MSEDGTQTGRSIVVDGFEISDSSDCWVIAEIGHNHQGSVEQAKQLLDEAKRCGANAVKTQKRDNRGLYTDDYFNRPYDNENSFGPTYGTHREALEFDQAQYRELRDYAREIDITFFATPFDTASVEVLEELEMPAYKIASADLTNTPLIRRVAETGKPMIMSTGAATLDDVKRGLNAAWEHAREVALLQCTAGYPPAWDELDLRVIETYRELFPDTVVGFSSHDSGIAMAAVAYVLGSRIVEKHFTLNRAMRGSDHRFSLEPQGLRKLVRDLRRVRLALGDGDKRMYPSEAEPAIKMGKKLVASRHLEAGRVLSADDVSIKSPGDGLPAYELDRIIGRTLRQPVSRDTPLTFELFEEPVIDSDFWARERDAKQVPHGG